MEAATEEISDGGDVEDLPSDFFDDFNKAEFMAGLSVVDECWEENPDTSRRPESQTHIDRQKDLQESIVDNPKKSSELNDNNHHYSDREDRKSSSAGKPDLDDFIKPGSRRDLSKTNEATGKPDLDDFIKPGSRRDLSKTNEAIKRDKEVKVKQFLAKTLEEPDHLHPPGTELDDFLENGKKSNSRKKRISEDISHNANHSERQNRSPHSNYGPWSRHSPYIRRSPHTRYRSSPFKPRSYENRVRPVNDHRRHGMTRYSPIRHSPQRWSPSRRNSPRRSSPKRSPTRRYPQKRSPRRYSRSPRRKSSRSPRRHFSSQQSRSRSPRYKDNFLYPHMSDVLSSYPGNPSYEPVYGQYTAPANVEFSGATAGYQYHQTPVYGVGFPDPYNVGASQEPSASFGSVPMPGMMNPAPLMNPATPMVNQTTSMVIAAPQMITAPLAAGVDNSTPYDALAQLVAEGKISKEDYLKLAPNKGVVATMETNSRVVVINRCYEAISKLDKLLLPNHLIISNQTVADEKYLTPKYCSPLKRQIITEFNFSRASMSQEQQTKQLVESIISTLRLDKVVTKYKKKLSINMVDAGTQTTKSQCDICEVRESTKHRNVGTSIEPEHFTATVHTQVVEQDLLNSKKIFNPSGSVGDGSGMSIAHLTPAQLVSQLAARAKTLKHPQESTSTNQFRRPNNDYDGRGGHYHHSYSNYRY